jgi:Fe2+ or Zn2+ uptake regulation protein
MPSSSQFLQDVKYNTYVLERQIGNPIDAATVAQVLKILDKEGILSK